MSTRKLQQEFDKLQKKVSEGLQQFEEIYEKIGVTENPSLKDKLEGDLRKEIKKLQRSRDQVKQWSGDSSNKLDKVILLDTRSRIENAMERFKEVEKVSKMKQFSNEGLELQTKLGARGLDEAKKNEAARYIVEVLDELNRQNELLTGEMVQLSQKKKSAAAQLALADLMEKAERNNSHISRLELVLRNLENYQLEPERIDEIKDDLDYYVENNQASDFVEYDDFYDVLELDESLEVLPILALNSQGQTVNPNQGSGQVLGQSQGNPVAAVVTSPKKAGATTGGDLKQSSKHDVKTGSKHESKHVETKPGQATPAKNDAPAHPRVTITIGNSITPVPNPPSSAPSASLAVATNSSAPPSSAPASGALAALGIINSSSNNRAPPPGLNSQPKSATPIPVKLTVAEELKRKILISNKASTPTPPPAVLAAAGPSTTNDAPSASPSPVLASSVREWKVPFWDTSANMAALAQARLTNPLPFHVISQQLEASLLNCPDSFDSEKPRQYNPINVHPSSVDYPQEPMFELNSASVMRKFDTDTLFFCFYYNEQQDALAKWNAARELSRRGWIFNSDSKQWFARETNSKSRSIVGHLPNGDEPVTASYKYFDYESSWLVRRKDNFDFAPELQRTF